MLRYVALVWTRGNAVDTAIAIRRRILSLSGSWKTAIDEPGLVVYYTGDSEQTGDVVKLPGQCGAIVGTLFEAGQQRAQPITRTTLLDAHQARAIARTAGRSLIGSHWGSYVLFLRQRAGGSVVVLRGPLSVLPCFWMSYRDVTVLASVIEDCISLKLGPFSINWDCIRAQAAGGDYLGNETAINEISSLVCGECMAIDNAACLRHVYWSPSSLRAKNPVDSMAAAATSLRETTQFCVNAWASPHKKVLVELSGGLDSSIVLGCLRRAPTEPIVVPVNFWSNGPADERIFARSMAEKTGTQLIECELDEHVDLRRFLTCARTGNPVVNFSAFDLEPRLVRLSHQMNATAIMTGELGDDIFGHSPAPGMIAECWQKFRVSPKFIRAAIDYAELRRVSLWNAIGQAISYYRWQRRQRHWSFYLYKKDILQMGTDRKLISEDVAEAYERLLTRFVHPWFRDVSEMPMGMAMLVWSLMTHTSTWAHSPFGGSDGSLFNSPLVSQPLVEAFVEIPTYLHFKEGQNGAVARAAFRSYLSGEVQARGTGKGTPDLWIRELIARNRPFLQELLLDGILVREKILAREKIAAALSGAVTRSRIGTAELIIQLYIEAWLRRWDDIEARAVA